MCAAMRFDCIANILLVAYLSSTTESEKSIHVSQGFCICSQESSYFQLSSEMYSKTEVY